MVRANELFRAYLENAYQTMTDLREALYRGRRGQPGGVRPSEFSLRGLAEHLITDRNGDPLGPLGLSEYLNGRLTEAGGAVTSSAFRDITGAVVNAAVLEGYDLPEFALSAAVRSIGPGNAVQAQLRGISIPMQDGKVVEVDEGQKFPSLGLYGEYVKSPNAKKLGAMVAITREAVLYDETGMVLEKARRVGEFIGLQKELLLTDYVVGAVAGCVIEKRVGDGSEATRNLFYESGPYVNSQENTLTDWTDIDAAENLFLGITMPGTGQPPVLTSRTLLVPPQLRSTAARVLGATETRSGSDNVVVAANPLAGLGLRLIASPLVYNRLVAAGTASADAAGTWFYGDLARAIGWYSVADLRVEEDTRDAAHDVIAQFVASVIGVPFVTEPRLWSRQTPS